MSLFRLIVALLLMTSCVRAEEADPLPVADVEVDGGLVVEQESNAITASHAAVGQTSGDSIGAAVPFGESDRVTADHAHGEPIREPSW